MDKFFGFGRDYVEDYHSRTGKSVFLHLRKIKKAIDKPTDETVQTSEDNMMPEPPAEKVYMQELRACVFGLNLSDLS